MPVIWSSGAWVGMVISSECAYDANGIQTMYARYSWSSGKWEEIIKRKRLCQWQERICISYLERQCLGRKL